MGFRKFRVYEAPNEARAFVGTRRPAGLTHPKATHLQLSGHSDLYFSFAQVRTRNPQP